MYQYAYYALKSDGCQRPSLKLNKRDYQGYEGVPQGRQIMCHSLATVRIISHEKGPGCWIIDTLAKIRQQSPSNDRRSFLAIDVTHGGTRA
jgi:hypothetical protein